MRAWWFAVIAVGAGALGGIGWWLTSSSRSLVPADAAAVQAHVPSDPQAARKAIADAFTSVKEYTPFFNGLQANFKVDYEADLKRFAARAQAAGAFDSPDVYFTDANRILRQTRGVVAARASPEAMDRVFDAQAAVLKAISRTDPHLCVDTLYGGATDAYFAFAATNRALVAEKGLASLAAILDGQRARIEPALATDADVQTLEAGLAARGLSPIEIAMLTAGAPAPALPDARICEIGQIYQAVMKELPEPIRWRMFRLALELAARG